MSRPRDLLFDYALGTLDAEQGAAMERALADDAELQNELQPVLAALDEVATSLPPLTPSASIRGRLLAAAAGNGRLAHLVDALASFFEVAASKARALLDAVDASDAWEQGPLPGVGLMHTNGGPRLATADVGLVCFPAGMDWPLHLHIGGERMLILEGGLREDDGTEWKAGQIIDKAAKTQHAFTISPDSNCVAAVIVWEGLEMPPGHRLKT